MHQVYRSAASGNGRLWIGLVRLLLKHLWRFPANDTTSSAKDQLTGQAVAVKKIMKPFSTPVLSKRTYRELKLLKHLRHENVRENLTYDKATRWISKGYQFKRHLYFTSWGHVNRPWYRVMLNAKFSISRYFVTELLGTDLHRLLTSRPLEKQFIQYFLYQILVKRQSSIISLKAELI